MKTTLATIAILLSMGIAHSAPVFAPEKPLRAELKRYIPSGTYTLNEIDVPTRYSIAGKFYRIESDNIKAKYAYAGRVNTSRGSNKAEASDFFDYIIIYNSKLEVEKVKIFNFRSSHGEGVTSPGWLKQFSGHNAQKLLTVGKNIDAISGATISVNNLTFDIQSKTRLLLEIVR